MVTATAAELCRRIQRGASQLNSAVQFQDAKAEWSSRVPNDIKPGPRRLKSMQT